MQGWKYFVMMRWVLQYRARVSDLFFLFLGGHVQSFQDNLPE